MRPDETAKLVREFVTAGRHVYASRYLTIAGFALLVYDHAITFHSEVNFVWPAELSIVKILFLINRYIVPIFIGFDVAFLSGWAPWLTDKFCQIWILSDIAMELFTVFSATFLIGMRVYILWDNRRSIFNLVSVAWSLHVVANLVLIILFSILNNAKTYKVEPNFKICMGSVVDSWTVWIPVMLYHCLIMILLVVKSLSTPRNANTRIHHVMIWDGFNYFFVVFIALLFNLLSWALAPPTLAALPRFFVWAVCTTATSRLLLSLKGIHSAKDWDKANNIVRRDVEMVPRNRIQFMFTEHEDDVNNSGLSRQHSFGQLKVTTLGRYDD